MTSFDNREQAFENKFAHDKEIEFKVEVKSYKLLGMHVAKHLRLNDEASLLYAMKLVDLCVSGKNMEQILEHVEDDLEQREIYDLPIESIRAMMPTFKEEARHRIMNQ